MKQFETNVSTVMTYLRDEKYSPSVISSHRLCYNGLKDHLVSSDQCYSADAAYGWLESIRPSIKPWKYKEWLHCLDQLEDVSKTGFISLDHLGYRKSAYSQLNPCFKSILDAFIRGNHPTDERYRISCARFLLYIQNYGMSDLSELNYDIILRFHEDDYHGSAKSKDVYEDLIRDFLRYLGGRGICSPGLALALNKLLIHQIGRLSSDEVDNCSGGSYPTVTLDKIEGFLSAMEALRYGKTVLNSSRHILTLLYIFLDMHKAHLSDELLWYWFNRIKQLLGSNWKQHRRSLCQFLHYLETGAIITSITGDPQSTDPIELLPSWAGVPLSDYLSLLRREGWKPSTIAMQKSGNLRFCKYLQSIGIDSFTKVTPDTIKCFNLQDTHGTPEGKAAYNCRIRSFIIYLYEQGLVEDPYLYRALPTEVSQKTSIIRTLSKEDVVAIWAVDPADLSPKALRDYAMVCIGLSMGLRASDIVALRFGDIDWKRRTIHVIQQKTGRSLTLPMPVKTGNILFRYLRDGRPKSSAPYVFIRHEAPYGRIQRGVCRSALQRFIDHEEDAGCSFHAVRKIFATMLLEGNTNVELISDSLGHSTDSTVHKYLSLDEKRMRKCPLSLEEEGISYEGGAFHA